MSKGKGGGAYWLPENYIKGNLGPLPKALMYRFQKERREGYSPSCDEVQPHLLKGLWGRKRPPGLSTRPSGKWEKCSCLIRFALYLERQILAKESISLKKKKKEQNLESQNFRKIGRKYDRMWQHLILDGRMMIESPPLPPISFTFGFFKNDIETTLSFSHYKKVSLFNNYLKMKGLEFLNRVT